MAIELKKVTDKTQTVKIVSSKDAAIDWDATYPEIDDYDKKEEKYSKNHKTSELTFLENAKPTLFVFKHPKRAEIAREIRKIYSHSFRANKKNQDDVFTEIFQTTFLGTEEGFESKLDHVPKIDGLIPDDYFQALEDAEVFQELSLAYIDVINDTRGKKNDNSKK